MKRIPFSILTVATLPLLVNRNENQMIARIGRYNREVIIFAWVGQTLVLPFIRYQVWSI